MNLPNFLLIGAPKAGTTALHHYLRQHPQVYLNPLKDSHFFLFDGEPPLMAGPSDALRRAEMIQSFDDYTRLFARATEIQAVGEVCVRYLDSVLAAERIARRLPGVRLIVILRSPVERAWSHYRMYRTRDNEHCATFAEAIAEEQAGLRDDWYRGRHFHLGLYHRHLSPWIEQFGSERILVLLYEDLRSNPAQTLQQLFTFIGVDPTVQLDTRRDYNVTGEIANPVLRRLWRSSRRLRSHAARYIPLAWRGRLSGWVAGIPVRKVPMEQPSPELICELIEAYRADITALQALIGRDLSHWLKPHQVG